MNNLGVVYEDGEGVPQDFQKANSSTRRMLFAGYRCSSDSQENPTPMKKARWPAPLEPLAESAAYIIIINYFAAASALESVSTNLGSSGS